MEGGGEIYKNQGRRGRRTAWPRTSAPHPGGMFKEFGTGRNVRLAYYERALRRQAGKQDLEGPFSVIALSVLLLLF